MTKLDKIIALLAWIMIFHQLYLHVSHKSHWSKSSSPARRQSRSIFDKLFTKRHRQHVKEDHHIIPVQKPNVPKDKISKVKNPRSQPTDSKKLPKHEPKPKSINAMVNIEILTKIPRYGSSVYHKKNDDVITDLNSLGVKCEMVQKEDSQIRKVVQDKMSKYHKIQLKAPFYKKLTKSCDQYIKKRGYITEVTKEEKNFSVAFGILMHKDIEVAERLLRAIYRPSNFYCIHIDAKSPKPLHEAMASIAGCFDNVFLASQSLKVKWGYYTVFQADLICMDDLLKYKKWKYYINLAGSEFPLKTNLELVTILKAFKGASSVSGSPFSKQLWKLRMKKTAKNITGITLMKGSQHIIAHRKFIEYIRSAPIALKFAEWLKNASHPHETFYNSLYFSKNLIIPSAYNGSAQSIKEPESMARFKLWKFNTKHCSGKWVRAICIFGIKELPSLVKAPHFFANKFHSDFIPVVLDCLESWLFGKIQQEKLSGKSNVNVSFYSKLDYIVNKI